MHLLDFVEALTDSKTVDTVWRLLSGELEEHGFDRVMYGLTKFRTANSLGDREDLLVLNNYKNPDYVKEYIEGRLYYDAPMLHWAAENDGACSWRYVADNMEKLTPKELRILEINRQYDLTAGYTISFHEVSIRVRGGMSLGARKGLSQDDVDRIWEEHGRKLHQMARLAHLKISTLPFPEETRQLTKRQREVLELAGDGKTMQEMSIIIGLSQATVEKHLRLAREALDVETTAQAVVKATVRNQIYILYS